MTKAPDNIFCSAYLDRLDAWLAGECDSDQMWAHHDSCESCRMETRLAREIGAIASALPELRSPDIHAPAAGALHAEPSLVDRMLRAWRQPLVLVPALALVLAAVFVIELRTPRTTAVDPDLVIIDGAEYTREEIQKAAADLETALRYLDKYGNYPAQVISAELEQSGLPLPTPTVPSEPEPTI